jgi:hypothetical protein
MLCAMSGFISGHRTCSSASGEDAHVDWAVSDLKVSRMMIYQYLRGSKNSEWLDENTRPLRKRQEMVKKSG